LQLLVANIVAVMLAWLTEKLDRRRTARELYGSIVTQARCPIFYADWGVPDTLQGRFEMVVLHISVLIGRLQHEGKPGADLGRALNEAFIADMDASMRELTFGDLAVPKEIKRAAAALFDRHSAYQAELKARQGSALARRLEIELAYLAHLGRLNGGSLAHYMLEAADSLAAQLGADLLAGRVTWPVPRAS
jgi:cytochrome b pre-mRNA-processing protein 3